MQIEDLWDDSFQFDVPVWTLTADLGKTAFILAHADYGPTILVFTDEDAGQTTAAPGLKTWQISDWPELRRWVEASRLNGVRYVGLDLRRDLSGQYVRIEDFIAVIDRATGSHGPRGNQV